MVIFLCFMTMKLLSTDYAYKKVKLWYKQAHWTKNLETWTARHVDSWFPRNMWTKQDLGLIDIMTT